MIHYDKYIVAFSGGKDSMACFLQLLELGIPKHKIELWHHLIDDPKEHFMDWAITPDYCRKFAESFDVPIYFSWKDGGFKGEMLRDNVKTSSTSFVTPDGEIISIGGVDGKLGTRLKFPQTSTDLSVRWCSTLKIDGLAAAIRNQERFNHQKIIVLSGERGEESKARSNYAEFEVDRSDLRFQGTRKILVKRNVRFKVNGEWTSELREILTSVTVGKDDRWVDRWRPVKNWTEQMVWDIIKKYRIRVHPCYYLGFGRCSCLFCIFGNANQFASANLINPRGSLAIQDFEKQFGVTIKRNMTIGELITLGTAYPSITKELASQAMASIYDQQIIMPDSEEWILPAGAFGESCGPI